MPPWIVRGRASSGKELGQSENTTWWTGRRFASLRMMGAWGPQHKAHEDRIDVEMDSETIPKCGGFVGRLDPSKVLGDRDLFASEVPTHGS
jgi:hypothetical protein